MIQYVTLGIPKGMKKNTVPVSIGFCLDFFIRNENVTSEECKTKNRLKKYCIWGKLQVFKVRKLLINRTFIYKGLTVT